MEEAKNMEEAKKILVVDDSKTISKVMDMKLRAHGFEVRVAGNGIEALEAIEKEQFDLIALDLIMPEMDGISFLTELKKREIDTPVIVTSNLGQDEDLKRAKELGAVAYLVKTNRSIEDIVKFVEEVLA